MNEITLDDQSILQLVTSGDCSKLDPKQKLAYYKARCDAAGLDVRCQPFQFISMNGKVVLYALKSACDQLASKHGIVSEIVSQITDGGIRTVVVRAKAKDGRQTDEIGCVAVEGMKGNDLANAYMKAVTKAKRRSILSLCGLGMLDETELETIPNVKEDLTAKYPLDENCEVLPPVEPKGKFSPEALEARLAEEAAEAKPKEVDPDVDQEPRTWEDVVVHIKCSVQGKKLGEISDEIREKIYTTFSPKPPYKDADVWLKNGIVAWKKETKNPQKELAV